MKLNLITPILGMGLLLSFFSCKQEQESAPEAPENTFVLNANIQGIEDDYLLYYENDDTAENGQRIDTLWIENDRFTFKDSITDYKMYFITVPQATRSYKQVIGGKEYTLSTKANVNRLWFIAYPGAEISYEGSIQNYVVDAYPHDERGINDDLAKIHRQIFPMIDSLNGISVALGTRELTDEQKQKLYSDRDSIYNVIKKQKLNFIEQNPKSVAASYIYSDMFYRKELDQDSAKQIFERFDGQSLAGTSFYDEVKMRFEAIEDTKIGKPAPELVTKNTLSGETFRLSDLKGNYVLLDYWGTWCGPCMGEMPKIKEINKKYADKNFIIVGVDQGDPVPRWEKAIKDNDFSWTHIRSTDENDLRIPFNVNAFPTKILIDPEGNIIYSSKNTEEPVDLYALLEDIMSS